MTESRDTLPPYSLTLSVLLCFAGGCADDAGAASGTASDLNAIELSSQDAGGAERGPEDEAQTLNPTLLEGQDGVAQGQGEQGQGEQGQGEQGQGEQGQGEQGQGQDGDAGETFPPTEDGMDAPLDPDALIDPLPQQPSVPEDENDPPTAESSGACQDSLPLVTDQVGSDCDAGRDRAVYVSTAGDDAQDGRAPERAVRWIQTAIERAQECESAPCEVRIAMGGYEQALTLASGVALRGGYSTLFDLRDPLAYPVTLSSTEQITVTAAGLTDATSLEGLEITGATLEGTDGTSSYALWVGESDEHLKLHAVTLRAGQGARGADGRRGAVITDCAPRGGAGGTAGDCFGDRGSDGDAGADLHSGGAGGDPGNSNCPNACPLVGNNGISGGRQGNDGAEGAHGAGGQAHEHPPGEFVRGLWTGSRGGVGTRGRNGTGGGGGGSGGSKRFRACFGCDTLHGGRGGDGAPGGCGGGGGEGGTQGGASVALLLWSSTVHLLDVDIHGGRGGDGGAGGDGREGAPGGTLTTQGLEEADGQRCGLINYSSGAGAPGGLGGQGGQGGGGGGGHGGPAYTVALLDDSEVIATGGIDLNPGEAGAGGQGGEGADPDKVSENGQFGLVETVHMR